MRVQRGDWIQPGHISVAYDEYGIPQPRDEQPPVPLRPGLSWEALDGWDEGLSTWVEGFLVETNEEPGKQGSYGYPLDIVCTGDPCCLTDLERLTAEVHWASDGVLSVPSLIEESEAVGLFQPDPEDFHLVLVVPGNSLTRGVVVEALFRALSSGLLDRALSVQGTQFLT